MKTLTPESRNVVILGTSIFIVITLFTMKLDAGSDGNNAVGFPLTFYTYYGGKRYSTWRSEFQLVYLFLDYLVSLAVSILLIAGIKKIRR